MGISTWHQGLISRSGFIYFSNHVFLRCIQKTALIQTWTETLTEPFIECL